MNNEVENEMAIQPECGLNKDKEDPSKNGHHPWCAGFFFHFFTPRSSIASFTVKRPYCIYHNPLTNKHHYI